MQLTLYTDYSLRVLIYLASNGNQLSTIEEISNKFAISRNHLTRVVHRLGEKGVITTIRGKGGGICLAHAPQEINLKKIIEEMESNFNIVECFQDEKSTCLLTPVCSLKRVLHEARDAFLKVLEKKTLADLVVDKNIFK